MGKQSCSWTTHSTHQTEVNRYLSNWLGLQFNHPSYRVSTPIWFTTKAFACSQIYHISLKTDSVQYLHFFFLNFIKQTEKLQNKLKLMQKTCTNAEEFSISLYSGTKCTLWDLIKKKNVNCHAWSNRIDYCYNNSINAFTLFFLGRIELHIH